MKRKQILERLGFTVPENKTKRVIVVSDIKNEADDHFAIMHHLLTPSHEVKGIVACHFEFFSRLAQQMHENGMLEELKQFAGPADDENPGEELLKQRGTSMERSYEEGRLLLKLAEIDDVPLLKGSEYELSDIDSLPKSEGADFIIEEAMRDDPLPLYVCMLGSATDLAIAYLKKPEIAPRLTGIWIGGGPYPAGGSEFNLMQDVKAANVLFQSDMPFWQVPSNVYSTMEFSFAELISMVKPCGKIGGYLCEQMLDFHKRASRSGGDFPNSEVWSIGDNPTVSVLIQGSGRRGWHYEKAPRVNEDFSYDQSGNNREIRVYDTVDSRLTIHDLFAKLKLCYGD